MKYLIAIVANALSSCREHSSKEPNLAIWTMVTKLRWLFKTLNTLTIVARPIMSESIPVSGSIVTGQVLSQPSYFTEKKNIP